MPTGWAVLRQRLGDILRGAALGRYERELRSQTAELNDLFLLLCFMEATALPNPATLYLSAPANASSNRACRRSKSTGTPSRPGTSRA